MILNQFKMEENQEKLRKRNKISPFHDNTNSSDKFKHKQNGAPIPGESNGGVNVGIMAEGEERQPSYRSAGEYAQAVQQWVQQYHMWNNMQYNMCMFPLYMNMAAQQTQQHGTPNNTSQTTPWQPRPPENWAPAQPGPTPAAPPAPAAARPPPAARPRHPVVFRIPSLWKRVLAEFIDFVILFIIKLGVTMLAVEHLGNAIDLERYDIDFIFNPDLDYNTAISMTSELIMMEVINRIFICFFETLCLHRGVAGQVGGSTPGKRIMGLRLVSCEEITDQPNGLIMVTPAGDVGLWNAFVRAVIKNFSMAFFFPVCLTVFFFQHNRAAYDVISNSAVVEPLQEDVARGY